MSQLDDCSTCHWRVSGGSKPLWTKYPGQSGAYLDEWCGAGRPEFNTWGLDPCPIRLEIVELEINEHDTPKPFEGAEPGFTLGPACAAWIREHMPWTKVKVDYTEIPNPHPKKNGMFGGDWIGTRCAEFSFDKPSDAVLFKMRWF